MTDVPYILQKSKQANEERKFFMAPRSSLLTVKGCPANQEFNFETNKYALCYTVDIYI